MRTTISKQSAREQLSDSRFDCSAFLEPHLRGAFGSPDLEEHIFNIFDDLSSKLLSTTKDIEEENNNLKQQVHNADEELLTKLEAYNNKVPLLHNSLQFKYLKPFP